MASTKKNEFSLLKQRADKYALTVSQRFSKAVNDILALQKEYSLEEGEVFSFDDNPRIARQVQDILRELHSATETAIHNGIRLEWKNANDAIDSLLESRMGKEAMHDATFAGWMARDNEARDAFMKRRVAGMSLSDRIWRTEKQLRTEMELALSVSIGEGKSASEISREVRKYLQEPDRLFRRVRMSDGSMRLSRAAAAYHPGQGIYRSSYKNAMRLARTETNMAYRAADFERWKCLDFVTGVRIGLSGSHPDYDVCDRLKGDYPKDFKFSGWHPNCFCNAVPITVSDDDFVKMQQAMMQGDTYDVSSQMIHEVPEGFVEWAEENKERVLAGKAEGRLPYFLNDNWESVNNIYNPIKKSAEYQLGVSVLEEMKQIPDVDTEDLKSALLGNSLEVIDAQTKKLQAIKDELNNLTHIENGLEEAKVFGYQEILKADKTVAAKLEYWKDHSYSLSNQADQISYFIGSMENNSIHPKTGKHLQEQYPSWKAQTKAYKKELAKVQNEIEWQSIVGSIKTGTYSTKYDSLSALGEHIGGLIDKLDDIMLASQHDLGALKKVTGELDEWLTAKNGMDSATKALKTTSGTIGDLKKAAQEAAKAGDLAGLKKATSELQKWQTVEPVMEEALKTSLASGSTYIGDLGAKVAEAYKAGDIDLIVKLGQDIKTWSESEKLLVEAKAVFIKGKNYNNAVADMEAALNAGDKAAFDAAFKEADKQKKYALSRRKSKDSKGDVFSDIYDQTRRDAAIWDSVENATVNGKVHGETADKTLRAETERTWKDATARERREKEVAEQFIKGRISEDEFKKICQEEGLIVKVFDPGYGTKEYMTGRDFTHEYTHHYRDVNMPLENRNYNSYGSKQTLERFYAKAEAMTEYIDNCVLPEDMWFQRGDDYLDVVVSRLNFAGTEVPKGWESDPSKLVGLVMEEGGFMSTGSRKASGFLKRVTFNIFAPKGTKAVYVEPFSDFGAVTADGLSYGDKRKFGRFWDGKEGQIDKLTPKNRKKILELQKELIEARTKGDGIEVRRIQRDLNDLSVFSDEHETLFQRGTRMRITRAYMEGGQLFIDVDIVGQSKRDLSYVKKNYILGKG
ncbi:MAG: hypothetical protein MJZ81_06305 [Bacteroidales bacterium]|nr:hypothetical protein [Bacteroidales bacterium]